MLETEGRAAWPSLFVFGAALLVLVASLIKGDAYRWGAIALLTVACAPWRAPPASLLSILLGFYCAWLLASAAFVTPAYNSYGIYLPVVFVGGFAAIAALGREASIRLFRAGAELLGVLVLIGLLQHFVGFWSFSGSRAAATFVTPNTLATAINLFLLPLVALYLCGRGTRSVFALALWLFAGLVATQSRGGMLAFFAGLAFFAVCMGSRGLWQARACALRLLFGFLGIWVAYHLMTNWWTTGNFAWEPAADRVFGANVGANADYRLLMYTTTFGLIREHWLIGAGANMFSPLFEAAKSEFFRNRVHPFAHNDYLQVWLEYGLIGFVLLVGIVGAALSRAWRSARRAPADPLPHACGAALASCFAHALVDFPLYVPFTLMVTGCYLGALAAYSGNQNLRDGITRLGRRIGQALTVPIRWALATVALAWLAQPVLADLATSRAVNELAAGRADNGLYWLSVASRLEPRNPVRYWAQGVVLREQAVESGKRALAARADQLMVEEYRADPYQTVPYLERASFHMKYPQLFDPPTPATEILSWTRRALELRPYSIPVQVQHARVLAYAGRMAEAKVLLGKLLAWHPEEKLVRDLAAELEAGERTGARS